MIQKKSPPGPSLLSLAAESIHSRLDYYSDLRDGYGDIVRVPNMISRSYLINNADCAEHILKQYPHNYIKGGTATLALRATFGHGILVNNGEAWRNTRKATAAYFHPKNLQHFVPYLHHYTQLRLQQWQSYANKKTPFDIANEMMSIIFTIAAKSFYHVDIEEQTLQKIIHAIAIENRFSTSPLVFLPFFPSINGWRYWQARHDLKKYLQKIITTRKNSPAQENDLLDLINQIHFAENLSSKDKAIFSEVKTFLLTGHETTGAALSWTMYLLASHPQAQQRVRDEVNYVLAGRLPQLDDIPALNYTRMVIEEALRLYPPIWMTGRKVIQDDQLQNYFIKKNSEVYLCPYTLHRHPQYWHCPDQFMPERHEVAEQKNRPDFAFIPFGGGSRICIASHLAIMQAVMITAMIIKNYHLELVADHPIELDHFISLKPRYGIKVGILRKL